MLRAAVVSENDAASNGGPVTSATIESRAAVLDRLRRHCREFEGQLLLAVPASVLGDIDDALAAAEDALRVVMIYGTPAAVRAATDHDISDLATVARTWDVEPGFTLSVADESGGLMVPNDLVRDGAEETGVVFGDPRLYHLASAWFMAHPWEMGTEWYIAGPPVLPATYEHFRQATLQATLALDADRRIRVEATAKPTGEDTGFGTVTGQLVATRQQFVYPKLSSVYGETTIVIRDGDGRHTIGGLDAYLEDFEARSVTLRPMAD